MKGKVYVLLLGSILFLSSALHASNLIKREVSPFTETFNVATGDSISSSSVSIYPSAAHDVVTVDLRDRATSGKAVSVEVFNILGNRVMSVEAVSGQQTMFHVGNLPSGIYFVRVKDSGNVIAVQKIVKQ